MISSWTYVIPVRDAIVEGVLVLGLIPGALMDFDSSPSVDSDRKNNNLVIVNLFFDFVNGNTCLTVNQKIYRFSLV